MNKEKFLSILQAQYPATFNNPTKIQDYKLALSENINYEELNYARLNRYVGNVQAPSPGWLNQNAIYKKKDSSDALNWLKGYKPAEPSEEEKAEIERIHKEIREKFKIIRK